MLRINQYIKNHRGQALVEFSLILPAFLLVLAGVLMFGLVMHDYISLAEAARAGARYAAIDPSNDTAIINAAKTAAPTYDPNTLTVQTTPATGQRTKGNPVTVTVTYARDFSSDPSQKNSTLFGVIPLSWVIDGVAVMRVE